MSRASKKLTARFVETVRKPGRYGDGDGLMLQVDSSGARRWIYRFRYVGRRIDMGLGSYPTVSLSEAREARDTARKQKTSGVDPVATRRAAKRQTSIPTFEEITAEVIPLACENTPNAKVRYQWEYLLGPSYCNALLKRPIDKISSSDIARVLSPVAREKPETARKLLTRLRRVFEHARVRLRDRYGVIIQDNPAQLADLKALGLDLSKKLTSGRQPALAYEQLPDFMAWLRSKTAPAARVLELLILTNVRTDAVLRAEWSEFDLKKRLWTIPIDHLKDKNHRKEPMRIPLSEKAASIVEDMASAKTCQYVFPGMKRGQPLSNMAMLQFLKKNNRTVDGKPFWTDPDSGRPIVPHGFRATFRTWAEEQTSAAHAVIEQAMGHVVGGAVERAYRRTDMLEARKHLMNAWARYCDNPRHENIIELGVGAVT